jgi:UDP-N-acetylmuramyl pentapeptide phosphotransferase/UDP-N-acetylglucosamine-1-phosphate transferase
MALIFGVTLAVSLSLTPLVRWIAIRRNLVDRPGEERRVHTRPVPRLGGLAMYAAFAVGVLLMFALDIYGIGVTKDTAVTNVRFEPWRILFVLAGAGIIAVIMAADDIRRLPALPRLFAQIGVALLVVIPSFIWPGGPNSGESAGTLHYDQGAGVLATTVRIPIGGTLEFPLVLAALITAFWIVGMTNTINWIDGLDGLAAGVSAISCAVLFIIMGPILQQFTLAYLPLILGAAILGFLPYNIHPARIFMGDSGAMFLGFTLAIISIVGGAKVAATLLLLGIPLLDGVYMIVYRLYRGRSPLSADRGHLHHRLLDIGLTQQQVVMIFYILSGAFGLAALLLTPRGAGIITIMGMQVSSSLFKLSALLLMVIVLIAMMIYITRRRFDRARSSAASEREQSKRSA